jgi:pyruvate,orthophosphate dikinase
MDKLIYFFGGGAAEGDASPKMNELLGGKGAHLHEMTKLGLPVPPGFTICTRVCEYGTEHGGELPPGLMGQVKSYMHRVEDIVGSQFGDSEADPLLVSARSGAPVSMPGMMETILNLGLTDKCIASYISRHGKEEYSRRFILDCYRRLYEMFGENVYSLSKETFHGIFDELKEQVGVKEDTQLNSSHIESLIEKYKKVYQEHNIELPQDPYVQLELAIKAVEKSATGEKARNYIRDNKLPEKTYTGVNVQTMVYGNENAYNCGTGVGFTRDPSTGIQDKQNPYGEFLLGGQGEDVVSGRRNVSPLSEMKKSVPEAYAELMRIYELLEREMKHVQDYEFTIWRGKLYMLQTRSGMLTGRASIRSACDMLEEGLIDIIEAVTRVTPEDMAQLLHKTIDYDALRRAGVQLDNIIVNPAMGVAASPGGGVGRVVFDAVTADELGGQHEQVVLCRMETDPADCHGVSNSQAYVTARGGKTSHAAVVARNKGIPSAVGTGIEIDEEKKHIIYKNSHGEEIVINEGDFISVDGSIGKVLNYKATLIEPRTDDPDLQRFLKLIIPHAKMRVWANANDAAEARRALEFGAEGIGLARTERMFLSDVERGENRALTIQTWVLAEGEKPVLEKLVKEQKPDISATSDLDRREDLEMKQEYDIQALRALNERAKLTLDKLEKMQKRDFLTFYEVMGDRPVIIRLLDYPLHELLSDAKDHLEELRNTTGIDTQRLIELIDGYHENNPMLGQRSIRLAITHPEVFRMQARAIFGAAAEYNSKSRNGKYVTPYVELSQIFSAKEIEKIGHVVIEEANDLGFKRGGNSTRGDNRYHFGIMFELAGASFEAASLARASDFGSFGTNDLSQSVMGWSREDGSTTFMPKYIENGIIRSDPFVTIDKDGPVAKAMCLAVLQARSVKPDYEFGICGEHAADPDSLEICYGIRLTNVSPGPNQVPIAWLRSAQLSLTQEYGGMLERFALSCVRNFSKVLGEGIGDKSESVIKK